MATTRTAEESKEEYIRSMGNPLGALFHALWQELAWLYQKWNQYDELFGKKPSRIDLLNEAAPQFFWLIQSVLWEDILLHIARLIDSPASAGRTNLTILKLPILVDDIHLRTQISELADIAIYKSRFCRDWRNRRIAHRDLELVTDENAVTPLASASRDKVRQALESISVVLNAVDLHYRDSSTTFEIGLDRGGALTLLYVLDDGVKEKIARQTRMRNGNLRDDDYSSRNL